MDIDFRGITVEIRSVPSITAQTGHSKFHVQNNVMFEVYAILAECEVFTLFKCCACVPRTVYVTLFVQSSP